MHTSQNCQSGLNNGVLKGAQKNDLVTDKENSTTLTLTTSTSCLIQKLTTSIRTDICWTRTNTIFLTKRMNRSDLLTKK